MSTKGTRDYVMYNERRTTDRYNWK